MAAPDTHTNVADAINKVLEAEHQAAAAIAAAQAAAQATIEAARERRREILETARQRVIRLHERAQAQLAAELERLDAVAARANLGESALDDVTADAIAGLAVRLTTDESA